jgi:hypothetical protein
MQPTLLRYVPWCFRDAPENRRPEATRLETVIDFLAISQSDLMLLSIGATCGEKGGKGFSPFSLGQAKPSAVSETAGG